MLKKLLVIFLILSVLLLVYLNKLFSNDKTLTNKNIIVIGDSLSVGEGWGTKLIKVSKINNYNYGNSGAGFVSKGIIPPYSGKNFVEMLEDIVNSKSISEKNSIDYLIVGGGINDAFHDNISKENVRKNLLELIQLATINFPNAEIIIFPIHTFPKLTDSMMEKYNLIHQTCIDNSILTTNEFINWANNKYDIGDNLHLTDEGYQVLADKILTFILAN